MLNVFHSMNVTNTVANHWNPEIDSAMLNSIGIYNFNGVFPNDCFEGFWGAHTNLTIKSELLFWTPLSYRCTQFMKDLNELWDGNIVINEEFKPQRIIKRTFTKSPYSDKPDIWTSVDGRLYGTPYDSFTVENPIYKIKVSSDFSAISKPVVLFLTCVLLRTFSAIEKTTEALANKLELQKEYLTAKEFNLDDFLKMQRTWIGGYRVPYDPGETGILDRWLLKKLSDVNLVNNANKNRSSPRAKQTKLWEYILSEVI